MDDRPPPYITNERYKSISRTLFQFGSALVGAGVVKGYGDKGLSIELAAWLLVGACLIWIGWLVLSLLESEK